MALRWYGKRVSERMRQAQVTGVNQTMAGSVVHARRNHSWQNRTGTLEGSIDVADYAAPTASGVRGSWGSRDVRYARIQEEGGVIRPVNAGALHFEIDGESVVVQQVTMPARPYLRPAADAKYPDLAGNIRRAYEGGAA